MAGTNDIRWWLEGLGLGQHASVFIDNAIAIGDLQYLTDADLVSLGLPLGPRRRLQAAIRALGSPSSAAIGAPAEGPTGSQANAPPEEPHAERRQLTVLFCDLARSTELARRLDPEDMARLISAYQDEVAREVVRYDGHVATFVGDGVLAYFGWPRAHEDDAERAVRAGLAMTAAVTRLETPAAEPLSARVGIATGLVVVGDIIGQGGSDKGGVVGETPNLAARLQSVACPGAVVVSHETRRLLGTLFEFESIGGQRLKGFAEPISAWHVIGEGFAESRFDALHGADLTPLVGRDHELAELLERWQTAARGEGQVVLIASDPGVGKSRIVRALRERLGEGYTPLSHYGSPYHSNSALYPVIQLLERGAGFERADSPSARLRKLESLLALGCEHLQDVVPLVAELLSLPVEAPYSVSSLSARQQKQRTLEALSDQLSGLSKRKPVLAVFEDAHWMDPTTLELLDMIVQRAATLPILVLITFRPDFVHHWTGHSHVTMLALSRLARRDVAAIVDNVTGGKSLPPQVLEHVLAKTDGIPLFVEELTKTIVESGLLRDEGERFDLAGPLPPFAIPATLHDSLLARLDRLAGAKDVAQTGAVVGRMFSYELLAALSLVPESRLRESLDELVQSELVFRRGTPPDATYTFKTALVQDAAYESLLRSRRHQLHARIAAVLEERFPEVAIAEPEVLAHHLSQADLHGNACDYWRRAGEVAVRRSANAEAIAHYSRALGELQMQPASRARLQAELALRMAIAVPLVATKGASGVEVEQTYSCAQALCEELGDQERLFAVLRGLWNCYVARGEHHRAYDLAVRLSALAEQDDGSVRREGALRRALAHRALGTTLFFLGRFTEAVHEAGHAIAIDDALDSSDADATQLFIFGERPGIISQLYAGWASWFLGLPGRSVAHFDAALARAEKLGHAYTLAFANAFAGGMRNDLGEHEAALQYATAASRIATKHDLPLWSGEAGVAIGYAHACLGSREQGIVELRRGIAQLDAIGDFHHRSHWLGLLAAAYLQAGCDDEAAAAIDRAMDIVAATNERYYLPELERLRGSVFLRQGKSEEAEAAYRRALGSAADMSARALELRAATSLARLWCEQSRRVEARDALAPVYGSFIEGFDTPDLREAKLVLDRIA